MKRIVTRSPLSSINKVRAALLEREVTVDRMTISRRLSREFGLKSYKPANKLRLTPAMKVKRLAFATKHQDWTPAQWGKVMFSDESTVQQFIVRKRHVRRPRGTRFNEKYTISTMKHPPSEMVWGAISEHGVAGISFLPPGTTMNDGAPCHRSKVAKTFLAENRIKVLDWPGNSPDLNPIDHLWNNMKNKVAEKHPSSAKDLVKVIKEVWVKELSQEF
ncbi:Transposable element Tcb2 transposase [Nymphon striatum]|nr:Transposable element Tcb2 transposase [Nymphon striatum]